MNCKTPRIIMIGPSVNSYGGISSVVKTYFDAGIQQVVDIKYFATTTDTGVVGKLLIVLSALVCFTIYLPFYDLVHVHMASRNSYRRKRVFINIAKLLHKKVLIHLHGGEFHLFYNNECSKREQEQIYRTFMKADSIIVLSKEWEERLHILFGNDISDKIVILHNAVTIPERFEVASSKKNNTLLFLGRVEKEKGVDDMLEVMPDLKEIYPDISLDICGGVT